MQISRPFKGATKSEGKTWKSHAAPHHTQGGSAHTQNGTEQRLTTTIAKAFWETTIKNQQQTAYTKPPIAISKHATQSCLSKSK